VELLATDVRVSKLVLLLRWWSCGWSSVRRGLVVWAVVGDGLGMRGMLLGVGRGADRGDPPLAMG
jgi:hypothetical protein